MKALNFLPLAIALGLVVCCKKIILIIVMMNLK